MALSSGDSQAPEMSCPSPTVTSKRLFSFSPFWTKMCPPCFIHGTACNPLNTIETLNRQSLPAAFQGVQMLRRIFMDVESVPPSEERRPLIKPEVIRKFCRRSGSPFSREDEVTEAGAGLCTDEQFRRLALHA